jgi:hypothetical protein
MSKESQIAEVLEDGTIYVFDLDVCDKEAEKAIKTLHRKEGKLLNFDFSATLFTLFVYCIHILRTSGWTTEELINEVIEHAADYDEEEDDDDD